MPEPRRGDHNHTRPREACQELDSATSRSYAGAISLFVFPPQTRTIQRDRGQAPVSFACRAGLRGPTVNQATANNLESGRCPQKTFSSNDQTIKTRPFPGCGTERRPAPASRGDAGHDIVSRPISRVLYPPERTVAISLGWRLPATSSDQPEDWAGRPIVLLFGLAPGGVCPAGRSPDRW